MKLTAGTIGTVLFTAAGIAVFVLMAKRPAVDGNAMNFGMPMQSAVVEEKAEEKMPEATAPEATTLPVAEPASPATEAEPAKIEEATMPATSETSTPAVTEPEVKTEEMPATMPTDTPAAESTGTTTN